MRRAVNEAVKRLLRESEETPDFGKIQRKAAMNMLQENAVALLLNVNSGEDFATTWEGLKQEGALDDASAWKEDSVIDAGRMNVVWKSGFRLTKSAGKWRYNRNLNMLALEYWPGKYTFFWFRY